jgi:hypothetical protein
MSYGRISEDGFARIAQANERHEGQFFQNLKERILPAQQPQQDFQADISNLYQLIESYGESMTLTQGEVEELKNQVDFIESYVYDTSGQPVAPEAAPAQPTGMEWYDEYLKQVSALPQGEQAPSPSQFLATY